MEAARRPDLLVVKGGRSLPFNIDAEESVLGGLLFDPEAIDRVIDILHPEAFYTSAHQEIYAAVVALRSNEQRPDLMTVLSYLHDRDLLEKVGGQNRLSYLFGSVVSAVNIDQHAQLIQDKYLRRRLIKAGEEVSELGYNNDFSIEVILDQAEQKVFRVGQDTATAGLVPTSDSVFETLSGIEAKASGEILPGITCGFYDLDAMTQGFQRSDLVIIAGRPGQGKTAFALGIAKNIAKIHQLPVAIFSLEMPKEQIDFRLMSAEAGIEIGKLRSGNMSPQEWDALGKAVQAIASIKTAVDDTAVTTISSIRSRARRYMAESGGLGAIVIDYLQLMGNAEGEDGNRVQELSRITRGLKQLARELNVPIFALSQLSRAVEGRTNKRPVMSDLRESGSIEQDSDLVIMLYRDEYYYPDTPDRGIAEVIITKQRNGPTGTIKLLFDSQYARFRNLAKRSGGDEVRVVRPDFEQKRGDRSNQQQKTSVSPRVHEVASKAPDAPQPESESASVDGWSVGDIAMVAIDHLDEYSQQEIIKNNEVPTGQKVLILGFEHNASLGETFATVRLPNGDRNYLTSDFLRRVGS